MTILATIGWVCLGIYAVVAAAMFISGRNATGDRAVGLVIPIAMIPVIVVFALALGFLQQRGWTLGVGIVTALLLVPLVRPRAVTKGLISLVFQPSRAGHSNRR